MSKDTISCLSLDLGSQLGWSRCSCRLRPTIQMHVTDHGTIDLNKLTDNRMRLSPNTIFHRNRVKMMIYQEHILKLVNSLKFDCYVAENVFCMPNRVNAFRSLAIYTEILESIVNVQKHKRLFSIPPTLIKAHTANYGQSDKSLVQQAIMDNPAIKINRVDDMSHHESDSIACCWAFLQEYICFNL